MLSNYLSKSATRLLYVCNHELSYSFFISILPAETIAQFEALELSRAVVNGGQSSAVDDAFFITTQFSTTEKDAFFAHPELFFTELIYVD